MRAAGQLVDEDEIVDLGVLLGEQYVRRFSWHWRYVNTDYEADGGNAEVDNDAIDDDSDRATYMTCVLSDGNRVLINPIGWISWILRDDKPNNILLNFNMVANGTVPRAEPNEAIGFH